MAASDSRRACGARRAMRRRSLGCIHFSGHRSGEWLATTAIETGIEADAATAVQPHEEDTAR